MKHFYLMGLDQAIEFYERSLYKEAVKAAEKIEILETMKDEGKIQLDGPWTDEVRDAVGSEANVYAITKKEKNGR